MTTTTPEWWTRIQTVTRLDLRPLRPLPSGRRIALAGLLSIAGSLVADVILSSAGQAAFNPPPYFGKFTLPGYAVLTVLGVLAATVGWAILVRMSSQPRWFVMRAAVAVTVILLIPDFMILPHNPTAPVIVLMVEHVVIAIITTYVLVKVAPAGQSGTSAERTGAGGRALGSEQGGEQGGEQERVDTLQA